MPIASQFQIKQMHELGEQMKVAPQHIRIKQMNACEILASELSSAKVYPLDYVIFRLTGYRMESTNQPLLLGDPLRSDLVSLVAVISRSLILSDENMLSVQEVAVLFGVSVRTISRLRKEGLIFHWVVENDGRKRIGCNNKTALLFLENHEERLQTATKFSQLSVDEQKAIIAAVANYEGSERTLNALASELAKKNHRSLETVRLLLKNCDQVQLAYQHSCPLNRKDARVVQRAIRIGVSWKTIEKHYKRTPQALRKAVLRSRSLDLQDDVIRYVELSSFSRKDAEDIILGVDEVTSSNEPQMMISLEEATLDQFIPENHELAIVSAMHLLRHRATLAIEHLSYSPTTAELDRIETDLRWSFMLHQQMVFSALPAGLSVVVQHVERPLLELPLQQSLEIIKKVLSTIWEVVSTIDPSRGQKVSRVATAQIDRLLSQERSTARPKRASAKRQFASMPFPSRGLVSWSRLLPCVTPEQVPSDVREIYAMRFGWLGHPKTIEEISTLLSCSEVSITRKLRRW